MGLRTYTYTYTYTQNNLTGTLPQKIYDGGVRSRGEEAVLQLVCEMNGRFSPCVFAWPYATRIRVWNSLLLSLSRTVQRMMCRTSSP